jgi:RNA polymerase sigma factor (sigma-70 family)
MPKRTQAIVYNAVDPAQHLGLVWTVAAEVKRKTRTHFDLEELVSVGNVGLVRAARLYDRARGAAKFCTYAWVSIHNEIIQFLQREQTQLQRRERRREEDPAFCDGSPEVGWEAERADLLREVWRQVVTATARQPKKLRDRIAKVCELLYVRGLTTRQAEAVLGIDRNTVTRARDALLDAVRTRMQ